MFSLNMFIRGACYIGSVYPLGLIPRISPHSDKKKIKKLKTFIQVMINLSSQVKLVCAASKQKEPPQVLF